MKVFLGLLLRIVDNFVANYDKLHPDKQTISINDISELNNTLIESIIKESLYVTVIEVGQPSTVVIGQSQALKTPPSVKYKILPVGFNSMKLCIEIPMLVLSFFNAYRQVFESELLAFVPHSLKICNLAYPNHSQADPIDLPKLKKTLIYNDFVTLRSKFLSMLCYLVRSFDTPNMNHPININVTNFAIGNINLQIDELMSAIVKILKDCSNEACNTRREILYSTRFLLQTRVRCHFRNILKDFFSETAVLGNGWTTCEVLRTLASSVVFDLVHHNRELMKLDLYIPAIERISKVLFNHSLHPVMWAMGSRVTNSLTDSLYKLCEREKQIEIIRAWLWKTLHLYSYKIRSIVRYYIPHLTRRIKKLQDKQKKRESTGASSSTAPAAATSSEGDSLFMTQLKASIAFEEPNFERDEPIIKENEEPKVHFGFPAYRIGQIQLNDMKVHIKGLFAGLKEFAIKLRELSDKYPQEVKAESALGFTSPSSSVFQSGFVRPCHVDLFVDIFVNTLKLFEFYNYAAILAQLLQNADKDPKNGANKDANDKSNRNNSNSILQAARAMGKEDKDVIELFAFLYRSLPRPVYRLVAQRTVDFLMREIPPNPSIQIVAHNLIMNPATSTIFSDILIEYLLDHMEVMGSNAELSALYLKLFKLVFNAVQLYPAENEMMLKPQLHKIVNKSMMLAQRATEPYNYFQILRVLFRSIGGGAHDLLYQEFLPMLPTLLQGLNMYQSGVHRHNMHDLFVELCLTIPVRLSSLLPYLPWLMDPLVSALNGAQPLVAQGLRTLELCVDNLQPDFLYEHIHPVKTELMQSLCKTLKNPSENLTATAFRILGKLGGASHKHMTEPQKLQYLDFMANSSNEAKKYELVQEPIQGVFSYISIFFENNEANPQPVHIPIDKVLEAANRGIVSPNVDLYHRQHCWEVVKGFLVANIQIAANEEQQSQLYKFFSHSSFQTDCDSYVVTSMMAALGGNGGGGGGFNSSSSSTGGLSSDDKFYKFSDEKLRNVHQLAIKTMLIASAIKELYDSVFGFLVSLVRYYTLLAISQHAGPVTVSSHSLTNNSQRGIGMDPLVLFDATIAVMAEQDNELCKPANVVVCIILDTCVTFLGSKERACQLPLFDYILQKMCALCYKRAWFSKYGGCFGIDCLFKRMTLSWFLRHQLVIFKALIFVLFELSNDLSCGVIEMAKKNLDTLIKLCAQPTQSNELLEQQQASNRAVVKELMLQLTISNKVVREESMHLLQVYAQATNQSVAEVIGPMKDTLAEHVPYRRQRLAQVPPLQQIGILEGTTYCLRLQPPLFDLTSEEDLVAFQGLYIEVQGIVTDTCNDERFSPKMVAMYHKKELTVQLKVAAMKTYASFHFVPSLLDEIFGNLYELLVGANHPEVQETAFNCIQDFKDKLNMELVRKAVRGLMTDFKFRELPESELIKCSYLARLFTNIFNEKFCEKMLIYLSKQVHINISTFLASKEPPDGVQNRQQFYEQLLSDSSFVQLLERESNQCIKIINLFTDVAATTDAYIEHLFNFLVKIEEIYDVFWVDKFYAPVIRFLKRFPEAAVEQFERRMDEEPLFRLFLHLLKSPKDGAMFRALVEANPSSFVRILKTSMMVNNNQSTMDMDANRSQIIVTNSVGGQGQPVMIKLEGGSGTTPVFKTYTRYQAIKVISIILKHNPNWLLTHSNLVTIYKSIWMAPEFHKSHEISFELNPAQWAEPKLLVKCMLHYYKLTQSSLAYYDCNREDTRRLELFELFFLLFKVYNINYHCSFDFFTEFLRKALVEFPVSWKRAAHLAYLDFFYPRTTTRKPIWSFELEAKILQYLILPIFAQTFKKSPAEVKELLDPYGGDTAMKLTDDLVNETIRQMMPLPTDAPNVLEHKELLFVKAKECDAVYLHLLQLYILFVKHASHYILSPSNDKKDQAQVRVVMSFGWHTVCNEERLIDPNVKYYGHLLLSHIISKVAIRKNIVRSVFQSLLKGYASEARAVVKASLDVLWPVLPSRLETVTQCLVKFTKSQLIQENYANQHVTSLLQLLTRYYGIYYHQRDKFIWIINHQMLRLGLAQNVALENRKASLDLAEVLLRWEYRRIREAKQSSDDAAAAAASASAFSDDIEDLVSPTPTPAATVKPINEPMNKDFYDNIISFLARFVINAQDFTTPPSVMITPDSTPPTLDLLCRRAFILLQAALRLDIYPYVECKALYSHFERVITSFMNQTQPANNFNGVCMALEVLIIFMHELKPDAVLRLIRPLQKVLAIAATFTHARVVRVMNDLLARLMALFPPSLTGSIHGGNNPLQTQSSPGRSRQPGSVGGAPGIGEELEPLEQLYTEIHSIILSGLNSYEKTNCISVTHPNGQGQNVTAPNMNPAGAQQRGQGIVLNAGNGVTITLNSQSLSLLYATLMLLKAACTHHPSYIDRLLTPHMVMMQKLGRDHLYMVGLLPAGGGGVTASQIEPMNAIAVEIICLGLELVRPRVIFMSTEMRRQFVQQVFIPLIEKTPDPKIMKSILRIIEDLIKQPMMANQAARASSGTQAMLMSSKVNLLTRVHFRMERGVFVDNQELQQIYLDLIYFYYSDETMRASDITPKLEPAFLHGLRCPQVAIRNRFYELLDVQLRRRLFDRLQYIVCEQNWEPMGTHFWIKQCIEIILAVAVPTTPLSTPNQFAVLQLPMSLVPINDYDKFGGAVGGFRSSGGDMFGGATSSSNNNTMMMDFEDYLNGNPMRCEDHLSIQPMETSNDANVDDIQRESMKDSFNSAADDSSKMPDVARDSNCSKELKQNLLEFVCNWHNDLRQTNSQGLITGITKLCHIDTQLAHYVWVQLLPRLISLLNSEQRQLFTTQLATFLISGIHSPQKGATPSAVGTMFEATAFCEPKITIQPIAMQYLAKHFNVWHRAILLTEQLYDRVENNPNLHITYLNNIINISENAPKSSGGNKSASTRGSLTLTIPASVANGVLNGDGANAAGLGGTITASSKADNAFEAIQADVRNMFPEFYNLSTSCHSVLSALYEELKEEDHWAGLWYQGAQYEQTRRGIAHEQQGRFELAKASYELAIKQIMDHCSENHEAAPYSLQAEMSLWERRWIRCSMELNQWDSLLEYAKTPESMNPALVMESAWRIPNWEEMTTAIAALSAEHGRCQDWKLALYRGFHAVYTGSNRLSDPIQKCIDCMTNSLVSKWRRLPSIIGRAHMDILHGAYQMIELQEAQNLNLYLGNFATTNYNPSHPEVKAVVKTWKNRMPNLADDLSQWGDIFTWRQHNYQAIVTRFEAEANRAPPPAANQNPAFTPQAMAMCGSHHSALSLITFARLARKHGAINLALESLHRIHTIPKVPILDCYNKIKQQLKCHLALNRDSDDLKEGLSIIESANLSYFAKEMHAELYALKGHILHRLKHYEEAVQCFSAGIQITFKCVQPSPKPWAYWAEFLDEMFIKSINNENDLEGRDLAKGEQAVIAYLNASRLPGESKAVKFVSKVFWLLSFDDPVTQTLHKAFEQYALTIPVYHWIHWVPQLLNTVVSPFNNNDRIMQVIMTLCKQHPGAIFFPVRRQFVSEKGMVRELYKSANIKAFSRQFQQQQQQLRRHQQQSVINLANLGNAEENQGDSMPQQGPPTSMPFEGSTVPAPSSMMRVSHAMRIMRESNPIVINAMEGIVEQLNLLHENYYDDVFRHLRLGLNKAYKDAFENRHNVLDATITGGLVNFIRRLLGTFGMAMDEKEAARQVIGEQRTFLGEVLNKRFHAIRQDPNFQRLKANFNNDFDHTKPENRKLQYFIQNMKKYLKTFEQKTRLMPKWFLLEERCRYLSYFTNSVVQIPLFGEYLHPKNCFINIAGFMPKVEVIFRHNAVARRFTVRGINGRIYPYLSINDSSWADAEREDRFFQILRLLNIFLLKNKETSRRQLYFIVPKVISSIPNCRIVEDFPTAVSLIDIFKAHFSRRGADPESPIATYYDRLVNAQSKGVPFNNPDMLRQLFTEIQTILTPKTILTEWAMQTYPEATDYWQFRRMFSQQLAIAGVCEYAFNLTRLNPDMMFIHRDTGLMNISYFRIDLKEEEGKFGLMVHSLLLLLLLFIIVSSFLGHGTSAELPRFIPFRLTASLAHFLTKAGIHGPYAATINAIANCMNYPNYRIRNLFYCIIKDELFQYNRRMKVTEKCSSLQTIGQRVTQMQSNLTNLTKERLELSAAIEQQQSAANANDEAAVELVQKMRKQLEELETRQQVETNRVQEMLKQAAQIMHAEIPQVDYKKLYQSVESLVKPIFTRFQGKRLCLCPRSATR